MTAIIIDNNIMKVKITHSVMKGSVRLKLESREIAFYHLIRLDTYGLSFITCDSNREMIKGVDMI